MYATNACHPPPIATPARKGQSVNGMVVKFSGFECELVPDITGWTLLTTMVTPRRYANLATATCKFLLLVKSTAK